MLISFSSIVQGFSWHTKDEGIFFGILDKKNHLIFAYIFRKIGVKRNPKIVLPLKIYIV